MAFSAEFDVTAADIKHGAALLAGHDQDGVHGAGDAVGTADHLHQVIALHFADVMDDDDCNRELMGQLCEPG